MERIKKIFFTSDQHFLHKNILTYCPNRQFETIEEHDKHIFDVWNTKINKNDFVFMLGDVALCSNIQKICDLLISLNGDKFLIVGNHDFKRLKYISFRNIFKFISYENHTIYVTFNNKRTSILLNHYPIYDFITNFHLHGHQHKPYTKQKHFLKNMMDIGVDSREDMAPWEKNELLTYIMDNKK